MGQYFKRPFFAVVLPGHYDHTQHDWVIDENCLTQIIHAVNNQRGIVVTVFVQDEALAFSDDHTLHEEITHFFNQDAFDTVLVDSNCSLDLNEVPVVITDVISMAGTVHLGEQQGERYIITPMTLALKPDLPCKCPAHTGNDLAHLPAA